MKTNQIIYLDTKVGVFKKSIFNITGVKDGEFAHLKLSDGRKFLVPRDKVLLIEIIPEDMAEATWGSLKDTYSANSEEWFELTKKK